MVNREAELDKLLEALNSCGGDDGEIVCVGCPYFHYARTSEIKCYAYLHRDVKKLLTEQAAPAAPAPEVLTELYQGFLSLAARVTALEAAAATNEKPLPAVKLYGPPEEEAVAAQADKETEDKERREKRERFLWGVKVDGD